MRTEMVLWILYKLFDETLLCLFRSISKVLFTFFATSIESKFETIKVDEMLFSVAVSGYEAFLGYEDPRKLRLTASYSISKKIATQISSIRYMNSTQSQLPSYLTVFL